MEMRAAVMVGALFVAFSAEAANAPAYWYHGEVLVLSVQAAEAEDVTFRWRPLRADGQPESERGELQKKVALAKGTNEVELDVGPANGHRVRLKRKDGEVAIEANRGRWSAGPAELGILRQRAGVRVPDVLLSPRDVLLARSFSAAVVSNPDQKQLQVKRTFGRTESQGVRTQGLGALVMIAKGDVGPVRLTLAAREKQQLQFWDYELVLDRAWRRFEIPFAELRPREGRAVVPPSIHSLALVTEGIAVETSSITVGFLGLGDLGPRVRNVAATERGVRVSISGPPRNDRQLHFATDVAIATIDVTGSTAEIGDPIAQKLWLCHRHDQATVCDPPDAPHTYYLRPPRSTEPLLIDDFETSTNVTAQRQPVRRFASSEALEREMTFDRRDGALRIGIPSAAAEAFAGADFYLGAPWPPNLRTLELRARGDVATDAVTVTLTDGAGKTNRLELRAYAPELAATEWRSIAIPLVAFRAASLTGFGVPAKLTVTLFGREQPALLELDLIRFGRTPAPTSVASFDLARAELTDLAGAIGYEASAGTIEGTIDPAGRSGRALRIRVRDLPATGHAQAWFGLGRLDATDDRVLTLSARSTGEARVALVLSDGNKKARFRDLSLGAEWRTLELPLDQAKKQGLRLDRLSSLLLIWDGRAVADETVLIDDIRLE